MKTGVLKEIGFLLVFFGSVWAIVSFYSEDEENTWDIFPDELEQGLGDLILEDLRTENELILLANDTFVHESWKEIFDRLEFDNSNCQAVYFTDNSEINAYTLPGDNILIYSALLEFLESGDEMTAVLAHEMGHVERDHVEQLLAEKFAIASLLLLVAGDAGGGLLLEISTTLFSNSFSRDKEREADDYAIHLLNEKEIPLSGFISFFERINEEEEDIPEYLSAFSTHPMSSERIENVLNQFINESEKSSVDIDWAALKEEMLNLSQGSD